MRRLARIGASIATLALSPILIGAAISGGGQCEQMGWASTCTSSDGSQVEIGGSRTGPGAGERVGGGERTQPQPPGTAPETAPEAGAAPGGAAPSCAPGAVVCRSTYEVVMREVTLADLAAFVPAKPALVSQPLGVALVGMPANLVARADVQTQPGVVLGEQVTVRFTPVAYVFDHGDGTRARSTTGGESWESLGQPQFTATATSHSYAEPGRYEASVTVEYAAAVDFGQGWLQVDGVVRATTGGHDIEVFTLRTALVERTCVEDPTGPGC